MKPFDRDENQIIEKLNQLPMVEDKLDKDEIYQRISQRVHNAQPKSNPSKKLIPILSTVFVVVLLFIIVPSFFNTENMETQHNIVEKETYDMASEQSIVEEQETRSADMAIEQNRLAQSSDDATEKEEPIKNAADEVTQETDHYVLQNVNENQSIIFGAVPDHQAQYVIPFSIIVPNEIVLDDYYSELSSYLSEDDWGLRSYLFDDVQFEIDQDNNQVVMNVPETFSLGDGGAVPGLLDNILSLMFRPYHIEKVIFQTSNEIGADLGPLGVREEMDLPVIVANYKLYRVDDEDRTFFIPIPQEKASIEVAINDLKNSDEVFNVYRTIPENVDFSIETSGNELTLEFNDGLSSIDHNETITMIESILMTAKSYEFEFVLFNNLPEEQIGPYHLSDPIKVPVGVNPIND